MDSKRSLANSYERTVRVVSALLYAFDPAGMGATVFAPADEYDDAAVNLVSNAHAGTDLAALVTNSFPSADDHLVDAVVAALELGRSTPRQ